MSYLLSIICMVIGAVTQNPVYIITAGLFGIAGAIEYGKGK